MPESKLSKSWKGELGEIIKVLLISLAIVLPIRYFIVQPFIVRGASMEPNFENREYLIVDEISYYFRAPQRGEPIVFRYPRDPSQFFIKRIIALPEEKVEIKDGRVKIFNAANPKGFMLEESYLSAGYVTRPDMTVVLGADQFFVMGDNRDFSSDSRLWGPLAKGLITGRAVFSAWPVERFGAVPEYRMSF